MSDYNKEPCVLIAVCDGKKIPLTWHRLIHWNDSSLFVFTTPTTAWLAFVMS